MRHVRQLTDDRQKALDELKKNAEENKQQLKTIMSGRRKASRAGSALAVSRRWQQDLDSGIHPRRARKMEKDRQRAASRRMETRQDRQRDWKQSERAHVDDDQKRDNDDMGDEPELPKPRKMDPIKHRGGQREKEKKIKAASSKRFRERPVIHHLLDPLDQRRFQGALMTMNNLERHSSF